MFNGEPVGLVKLKRKRKYAICVLSFDCLSRGHLMKSIHFRFKRECDPLYRIFPYSFIIHWKYVISTSQSIDDWIGCHFKRKNSTEGHEQHCKAYKDGRASRGPWMHHYFRRFSFFQHAPTLSKQVTSRENWVTASCCEMPHVYPRPDPTPLWLEELCNAHVTAPLGQWAATHGERKHRCTWLGWCVHVRGDDCSTAEAIYFGNNNSPLAFITQFNQTNVNILRCSVRI